MSVRIKLPTTARSPAPPPGRYGLARRSSPLAGQFLPGGTSDIGGGDVGGVPVQTATGTVIFHGGPGISVRGGLLAAQPPTVRKVDTPLESVYVGAKTRER
jgi:hypothetical protein